MSKKNHFIVFSVFLIIPWPVMAAFNILPKTNTDLNNLADSKTLLATSTTEVKSQIVNIQPTTEPKTKIIETTAPNTVLPTTDVVKPEAKTLEPEAKIPVLIVPKSETPAQIVLPPTDKKAEAKILMPEIYSALTGETVAKIKQEKNIEQKTEEDETMTTKNLYAKNEIKEVKLELQENQPVYLVKTKEPFKLFGFLPIKIKAQIKINGSDGLVMEKRLPWYSVFGRVIRQINSGDDPVADDRARQNELLDQVDKPQINFTSDVAEAGENDPIVFTWNVRPSPVSESPIQRVEILYYTLPLHISTRSNGSFTYFVNLEDGLTPFTLRAIDRNGRISRQNVEVNIIGRPIIDSFTATPDRLDRERGEITLAWSTRNVSRVELSANPSSPDGRTMIAFPASLPVSGSFEIEPIDTTEYTLTVYNSLGDNANRKIRVAVSLPDLIIERLEPRTPSTLRGHRGYSTVNLKIKNITETDFLGVIDISGNCGAGHCYYYNPTIAVHIPSYDYYQYMIYRGEAPRGMSPIENFVSGETYNFNFSFITDKPREEYAGNNSWTGNFTVPTY